MLNILYYLPYKTTLFICSVRRHTKMVAINEQRKVGREFASQKVLVSHRIKLILV